MNLFARLDGPRWTALAIVLAAVLFLCINILANFWLAKFRIDATEGGSYTISKQIKPVFAAIGEPVTVTSRPVSRSGCAPPATTTSRRRPPPQGCSAPSRSNPSTAC